MRESGGEEERKQTILLRHKDLKQYVLVQGGQSVQYGGDHRGMEGIGTKVGFGQIPKGSACHTKELGALLLVMNNQKGLREKVQTEATFGLKKCFISPIKYVSIIGISCQCLNLRKFHIKIWIPGFLTTITMATKGQPQVVTIVWM